MKAQVGKLGKALSNVQVLYYSLPTCLTVTVQLQGCGVITAPRSQITPQMRDRPQSSGAEVTRDTAGPPCCMMDAVWMWYGCGWSLHTYPTPHQPWRHILGYNATCHKMECSVQNQYDQSKLLLS